MTITFKTLKYKHKKQVDLLLAKIEAEEAEDSEIDAFVMSLIADWGYIDPETGQKVPVGNVDELTMEQYNDCMKQFNEAMSEGVKLKKTNDSPPSSGSRRSGKTGKGSQKTRASYLTGQTG